MWCVGREHSRNFGYESVYKPPTIIIPNHYSMGRTQRYCPRDARPNRSTLDLSRSLESDAGFRGGRSRPCLLCAHRFSADSVRVDAGRLARPRPYARARSDSALRKRKKRELGKPFVVIMPCSTLTTKPSFRDDAKSHGAYHLNRTVRQRPGEDTKEEREKL